MSPANRAVRGAAIGGGLVIVGFEFEYADTTEDATAGAPSLKTGMGNVLLQTPSGIRLRSSRTSPSAAACITRNWEPRSATPGSG